MRVKSFKNLSALWINIVWASKIPSMSHVCKFWLCSKHPTQPFEVVLISLRSFRHFNFNFFIFKSATGHFNLTGHEKYIQIFYLESCLWLFRCSVNGNTGTTKFWLAKRLQAFHQIQLWKGLFESATHVLYLSRWPIFVETYFRSGSVLKF